MNTLYESILRGKKKKKNITKIKYKKKKLFFKRVHTVHAVTCVVSLHKQDVEVNNQTVFKNNPKYKQ